MTIKKPFVPLILSWLLHAATCHAMAGTQPEIPFTVDEPRPDGRSNEAARPGFVFHAAEEKLTQSIRPDAQALHELDKTPQIIYDPARLPEPVRAMREKIIKAAKTGNIEALRPLLAAGDESVRVKPAYVQEDPITYLKELSGDGEGLEILAILIDLLNSGCVRLDFGGGQDAYVWPYFVAVPLDRLSKPQLVEAYQIMTANDFETIKEVGTYIYFRIGISPDGTWRFFLTGDPSETQSD